MRGQFLIAELLETPWALKREVLSRHVQVAANWVCGRSAALESSEGGDQISAFEVRRREANARIGVGDIAVIPVFGTIVQRAGLMTEWCGGSSTQQISAALSEAMADDKVSQILMEFDSPGGSVYGVAELGDEILQARKAKPVVGIANSLSASAGYWLMSQCSECYVTRGGEVGSIGVWMAHEDWSKALEEAGIKTTLISSGKFKTEGNYYEPLGEDALAFMQSRVDDYYRAFTQAVAKGRGVPIESVRSGMGEGRCLGADAALAEKMVDGVMTLPDLVNKMRKDMSSRSSGNAMARNRLSLGL